MQNFEIVVEFILFILFIVNPLIYSYLLKMYYYLYI